MPEPPRLSAEDVRTILSYDRLVFDRFVRRIRNLPKTEAMRPRGIGHESLFDTLVHILNVHEVWHVYIVRGRNSDRELEALFRDVSRKPRTWKEFDAYAHRVWAGVDATYAHISQTALGRRVKVFWMPGKYTVRDAVLQTTFEEAHHLGEVIGALWQDDRAPPEMTWLGVRRSRKRPARPG